MEIPISNPFNEKKRPKLFVETVSIYKPAGPSAWAYSHHPHLAFFKGKYYAIWSNGKINEDDVGQRVLMAVSEDFLHWSEPQPLVDSRRGLHSDLVLTAAGFHQHGDTLVAYYGQYEYKPEQLENGARKAGDQGHMNTSLFAMATDDGSRWSEPADMRLPIISNHGPQRTQSGRLLISGNIMFPYSDDPAGLTGWNPSGIYPPDMSDTLCDDSESFWLVKERRGWPAGLCEGSFYQTDDGILHMLLRSSANRLWVTRSSDDGETWSNPRPTGFTDNNSKFHFGKLPDGTIYYVGTPDREPRGKRNPLVLSLSRDGMRFDRHFILKDEPCERRFPGMYKGGDYGYPHTLLHDGCLHVIYSVCKESVSAIRVPIETI
ncbi:hypothetical protein PAESOLCIP111_03765 [Paenibacillus solanacearum]|uniref:Sialidase domain-containing protein n=1 Tax=Paenibacillus solanacearum TaxID=2048548 RepID=A0A916K6X4_9BACL|nr:exo-alpha-sialidase [Paenibacillus solanacearum]CAG7636599.1 hypothetical protein PAESOLCIP111_03765 [Paenibacillus solanacearum]